MFTFSPRSITRFAAALAALFVVSTVAADGDRDDTVTLGALQWAMATNGDDVPWAQAREWCDSLTLAGHDDWRLPTLDELRSLHEPSADNGIRSPFELDTCCLWSATTLDQVPPDSGGDTASDHSRYAWGFLYDGGIRYFSFMDFPDGRALCTREAG